MPFDPLDLRDFAVLLDVDGTILDIAPTPHAVHVPETLLRTLSLVGERTHGAIALVSGRPIANLDLIFAPLRLPAIGGHGAEIRPDPKHHSYEQRATALDRSLKQKSNGYCQAIRWRCVGG